MLYQDLSDLGPNFCTVKCREYCTCLYTARMTTVATKWKMHEHCIDFPVIKAPVQQQQLQGKSDWWWGSQGGLSAEIIKLSHLEGLYYTSRYSRLFNVSSAWLTEGNGCLCTSTKQSSSTTCNLMKMLAVIITTGRIIQNLYLVCLDSDF